MKLSFLGQSYEASVTPFAATAMTEKATFLGQQYTRKQVTTAMRQPSEELMYRGVLHPRSRLGQLKISPPLVKEASDHKMS